MMIKIMVMLVVGGILMAGAYVFAQVTPEVIDQARANVDIASKKAVDVGNKHCPVSKDLVASNDMGAKPVLIEYNGKIYHLCCPMCIKDFKKDPEKFSKIAEVEVNAIKK